MVSIIFMGYVGWSASQPNPYFQTMGVIDEPQPYAWEYVVFAFVYCAALFALLRPWKNGHPFIGSAAASGATLALVFAVGFSLMHAPPAHDATLVGLFFVLLGLIFYSGYCFAHWRIARRTEQEVI